MKKLLKSDFFKSVLTLFTGTALSQVIPMLASFALARLYDDYDYGVLEFFLKIQSFLVFIATLRYDQAVPLPKQDKHAYNLFSFSFRFNLIFLVACQILVVILYLCNESFSWGIPKAWVYIFLPITVFFLALNSQFDSWFTRKEWYKQITISRISSAITNNGVKIILGLINFSFVGLIIGNITGAFAGAIAFFKSFVKHKSLYKAYRSRKSERVLIKEYKEFPLITLPHSLTDVTRDLLFVGFLAQFYGWETLGAYAMTFRMLKAPISFMGTAVGQVYFQKISNKVANGKGIYALTKRTTLQLFGLSAIPFLIIGVFSPVLFPILLGDNWKDSGMFAQVMAPWMFVQFVSSPLSRVPTVLKKQKQFFILSVTASIFMVLSIWIGGTVFKEYSFYYILMVISLMQLLLLLIMVIWILKITKDYDKKLT
jgi:O-antigen/teichoic acid export membrane protein